MELNNAGNLATSSELNRIVHTSTVKPVESQLAQVPAGDEADARTPSGDGEGTGRTGHAGDTHIAWCNVCHAAAPCPKQHHGHNHAPSHTPAGSGAISSDAPGSPVDQASTPAVDQASASESQHNTDIITAVPVEAQIGKWRRRYTICVFALMAALLNADQNRECAVAPKLMQVLAKSEL